MSCRYWSNAPDAVCLKKALTFGVCARRMLNIPFGLGAAAIIGFALRERRRPGRPAIDYAGAALLTLSMTFLMLALFEARTVASLLQPWRLLAFAAAVAGGVLFVRAERRAVEPIVPLGLLAHRVVGTAVACGFLAGAARHLAEGGRLALSDFVPPREVAQELSRRNTGKDEATLRSYGQVDLTCPVEEYRELAAAAGLALVRGEDISAHTLPTYAFLRADLRTWADRKTARWHERATARLESATRLGLLRYTILGFAPQACAADGIGQR